MWLQKCKRKQKWKFQIFDVLEKKLAESKQNFEKRRNTKWKKFHRSFKKERRAWQLWKND